MSVILLSISLLLIIFPVNAESVEENGFSYEILEDDTACITAYSLSGDIIIPDKLGGHTVTKLKDELFYGRFGITSVHIPATVIHLGNDIDNTFAYVLSYCYGFF